VRTLAADVTGRGDRVAVVGGGLLGMTLALRLAERGSAVTLFEAAPEGAFSTNLLWDRAIAQGRVLAVVHDGLWFHLSTPADLTEAEVMLQARVTGETR